MNTDIFEGKWRQLKGEVRKRWGQLTDDEIEEMEGRQEKLIGKLQEKYGYTRVRAEQEVNDFLLELEK
jgi:uncharacterized protein YjbJ (UPF0337 family)